MKTPRIMRYLVTLATCVLLGGPGSLVGQTAPSSEAKPAAADGPISLSPFEVSTTRDTSYAAAQTLAGTRLATDLKDVASQITVMTPEFLQDVGATNLEEAMAYSLNVENSTEFVKDVLVDARGGIGGGPDELNSNFRSRGLASASNTRDFFPTWSQLDTYNTERLTIASGPNAILFGLGSPSGIIDQSLKRARFNNLNRISLRTDSEGSYRAALDFNRVLIRDRLALRGDVLYNETQFWRKPSLDRSRRQYATVTYRPVQSLTVRASYENIRREASIPRNSLVKDAITPYLTWRAARMQQLGSTDPFDPRLYWAPNNQLSPGELPFDVSATSPIQTFSPGQVGVISGAFSPDTPAAAYIVNLNGSARSRIVGATLAAPDTLTQGRSLTDKSLLPYDVNIPGLSSMNFDRSRIVDFAIEQKVVENLFVEAAYHRETYDRYFTDWLRYANLQLAIDVNRYIPGIVSASGQPILNPNRGKWYVESWGLGYRSIGYLDNRRATGSYTLDLTKRRGWMHWLGKHNFAGLFQRDSVRDGQQSGRTMLGNINGTPGGGFANATNRNNRQVATRFYLDPTGTPGGRNTYDPWRDVLGLNNAAYGAYSGVTIYTNDSTQLAGGWAAGSIRRTITDGRMFTMQNRFLEDRLIFLYGRRTDDFKVKTLSTGNVIPNGVAGVSPWYWNQSTWISNIGEPTLDRPDVQRKPKNDTRGVVLHPLRWISLHYSESTNSSAGAATENPNGGFLEPSSGQGKDYGLAVNLFRGRLSLKANWYENNQTNNRSASFDALKTVVYQVEGRAIVINQATPGLNFAESTNPIMRGEVQGGALHQVNSDFQAKGQEYTVIANLTPGWRTSISAARTESVESNIGLEWRQYVASRQPEWNKLANFAWTQGADVNAGAETFKQHVDSALHYRWITLAQLVDGQPSLNVRKWRVNFVTSYAFKEGRWLKNFGLGGAVRWRSEGVIGMPATRRPDGSILPDIHHPYYDDGLKDIDSWLSYRTKLWSDKVRARFQLNVRNLFDDQKLIPQFALSTGERVVFAPKAPRQFVFSADFDF